jgi:hypothetical protein
VRKFSLGAMILTVSGTEGIAVRPFVALAQHA